MNAAFSPRALNDFEPEMDVEILRWKGRIYDMVTKDGVVAIDMSVWGKLLQSVSQNQLGSSVYSQQTI